MKTIDTLDNRPFKHLITTIGALPTSFIDSMSYYEMLAWLCDYLQNTVIPAVDNNAEALSELQAAFVELKDYVDEYFDNLDIQTEIDNKLDEMAESGQLAEIIALYLEVGGVLAFAKVSDITSAENLVNGSKLKTYGYKRMGDGVYDMYNVRTYTTGDVIDGYNIVSITASPTLIAERLDYGKEVVVKLIDDDNIEDYIALDGKKTIILKKGESYTLTDPIYLNSDTTLDLNGATVTFDIESSVGIFTYKLDDTFTGYDGNSNITIKNGKIIDGCISMLHTKNVTFENVEFSTATNRHSIQLAGCYNVTIKNCIFNGVYSTIDYNYASECINIDPCIYGGQPYAPEESPMFDRTPNRNITIDGNKFLTPASETLVYMNAVGTHGMDENYDIAINVFIINNDFGSPAYSAINLGNYKHVVISNNSCIGTATYGIIKRGYLDDVNINNNNFSTGTGGFYRDASNAYPVTNLVISNNTIKSNESNSDSNAVIRLNDVQGGTISNNTITYNHHAIYVLDKSSQDGGDPNTDYYAKNIVITENTFIKKVTQDSYFNCRLRYCDNITFSNNKFLHPAGGLESNYREFLIQTDTTNLYVIDNYTDSPRRFMDSSSVNTITSGFKGNNARYQLLATQSADLDDTGTLPISITRFSKILLLVGSTNNTQVVTINPWIATNDITDAGRTWKYPVVNDNNTVGYVVFSTDSSGVDWTFTGTLGLRFIAGID